jgi:integrase
MKLTGLGYRICSGKSRRATPIRLSVIPKAILMNRRAGGANAAFPLGPKCVEILAALKRTEATPSTLVFSARNGSPLSRRNLLNRQLKPAAKAFKLTGLDSTGAPIGTTQALLGHSSSEISRGTCIHSVPADARKAVEEVERLFGTRGKLIGPKWTQVPDWPEMGSSLIN